MAVSRRPSNEEADVAQLVEHSLGKGEVTGSIPVISSRIGYGISILPVGGDPRGIVPAGVTQW